MGIVEFFQISKPFVQVLTGVPWERLRSPERKELDVPRPTLGAQRAIAAPAAVSPPPPQPEPAAVPPPVPQQAPMAKPGCTAADETGQVWFHLSGIAEGKPGSGVLRLDVDRLDRAAQGAEGMGHPEIAEKIRRFKDVLPQVRDAESAQRALVDFKPLVDETWYLGQRCGLAASAPMKYARELASKVKSGEMSYDAALKEMRARLASEEAGAA